MQPLFKKLANVCAHVEGRIKKLLFFLLSGILYKKEVHKHENDYSHCQ